MTRTAIRIVVPIAVLGALLYVADWSRALVYVGRIPLAVLIGSGAAMVLGLVVSTLKWEYALRLHDLHFSFAFLLRTLCTGFFLNCFLPTAVGGDAYRVYRTLPAARFRSRALSAVIVERAVGLLVLLFLGGIGALIIADRSSVARIYCLLLLGSAALGCLGLLALERGWLHSMTSGWEDSAALNRIRHAIGLLHNRTGQWSALLAASIAFQAISIAIIFALFAGLDANVGPAECALIAAMVGVAAALPLSINGLGLMEGALVGGAVALGIDYEEALVVAFVRRLLATCLAAGCGVVHLGVDARGEGDEGRGGVTKLAASLRGHALAYLAAWKQSAAVPSGAKDQRMLAPGDAARLTSGGGHQEEERHWPQAGLLEDTHDAIIIWEMDGNGIQYFNRAAERLYGYSRKEAAGKTTHALLMTRLAGGIDLLEHDLARFGVWVGELEHTTRDGRPVLVESRLALLSQQNGRWLVLEVNSAITERKAMEGGRRPAEEKIAELLALGSTP